MKKHRILIALVSNPSENSSNWIQNPEIAQGSSKEQFIFIFAVESDCPSVMEHFEVIIPANDDFSD